MKKQFSIFNISKGDKGFTLLLSALIASIVLSIGAAIFSIALKQITLASTGKNSQFAFYAADAGAECALYWDIRFQAFASSSASNSPGSVTCSTPEVIAANIYAQAAEAATTTMFFATNNNDAEDYGYCVGVTIAKHRDGSTGGVLTTIHADGYSTVVRGDAETQHDACTPASTAPGAVATPVVNDRNALQRSVELHY